MEIKRVELCDSRDGVWNVVVSAVLDCSEGYCEKFIELASITGVSKIRLKPHEFKSFLEVCSRFSDEQMDGIFESLEPVEREDMTAYLECYESVRKSMWLTEDGFRRKLQHRFNRHHLSLSIDDLYAFKCSCICEPQIDVNKELVHELRQAVDGLMAERAKGA